MSVKKTDMPAPEIIKARETIIANPKAKAIPKATNPEIDESDIVQFMNKKYNEVRNKTRDLINKGFIDNGGTLLAPEPDLSKNVGRTAEQLLGQRATQLGRNISPGAERTSFSTELSMSKATDLMYRLADKANLKTAQQFATAFPELMKQSPEAMDLFSKPENARIFPNAKEALAQHYADLIRERDAKFQKRK